MEDLNKVENLKKEVAQAIASKIDGMNRTEVSSITDTSRTDISRIVNLHTYAYSLQKLIVIANKLDIGVSFLITQNADPVV